MATKVVSGERRLDGRVHGQRARAHLQSKGVIERPDHITDGMTGGGARDIPYRAGGGRLTAAARNKIPGKDFAGPDRSYPIEDASHARNALARVSNKSPALKARVSAAVHKKYPGIGKG